MGINLEELYTCPDCGETTIGTDLPTDYDAHEGKIITICPHCGVIQDDTELEKQLGYKEEE